MNNLPDFSAHGYSAIKMLGSNSAGGRIVYLANDRNAGDIDPKQVVIKQFQFAKGAGWSGFKAIEREIKVLQGLNHEGIPCYLGSFETDDGYCIVQEYKSAHPLSESRHLSPDQIKQVGASILEILVYLQSHTSVIIHRDIKPENVLIDEQLNVYLIDFGFAQIGDGEVAMSNSTSGTLGFMAPEQIYNKEMTKATDLYGLGTMLIALLTRTKSTAMDTLIDDDGKIAFKHLVPKLNLRFVNWLEKMIAPNLKERYPNAEVALKELQPLHAIRDPFITIKLYRIQIGLAALGLASLMMLTNPRRDSYVEYASWKFTADVEKIICKNPALPDFINNAPGVAELCKTIISSRRKDIIELVDSLSKQDNYIFFSIYTTRIAGNEYRTLAAFSNFWTFEAK